jgi:hypothetical protein
MSPWGRVPSGGRSRVTEEKRADVKYETLSALSPAPETTRRSERPPSNPRASRLSSRGRSWKPWKAALKSAARSSEFRSSTQVAGISTWTRVSAAETENEVTTPPRTASVVSDARLGAFQDSRISWRSKVAVAVVSPYR